MIGRIIFLSVFGKIVFVRSSFLLYPIGGYLAQNGSMRFYPIIHLLPGMSEIIFVVTKQQINVVAAIQGMAATVGNARLCLNTVTHRPSQNMCIRYMP